VELVFTAQNIILSAVAAFAFLGGIGFYLRWSYLGWREGQRLSHDRGQLEVAFSAESPRATDRAPLHAPS
jgi:hypothetical protein